MSIPSNPAPKPSSKSFETKPAVPAPALSDKKVEKLGKQLQKGQPVSGDLDFDVTSTLETLPPEIWDRIFSELHDPSKSMAENIKTLYHQLPSISKAINANLTSATNHLLNQNVIDLGDVGCKNSKEAVRYIIDHQLLVANLSDFQDVDDEDLKNLSNSCRELISLSLYSKNITEAGLAEALKKLINLQKLNLENCNKFPGGDEFAEALGQLINLRILNLGSCTQISGGDKLAEAIGKLINLESLNFSYCKQFSGVKFIQAIGKLTKLNNLDLEGCNPNSGELFAEELKKLFNLKILSLNYCKLISGDQLITIAKTHPNLVKLNLTAWKHISGDQFVEALGGLSQLRSLDLRFCPISYDQFIAIIKTCSNLQIISMHHTEVSKDEVAELRKKFPMINLYFQN